MKNLTMYSILFTPILFFSVSINASNLTYSYSTGKIYSDTIPDFYQRVIDISPNDDFINDMILTSDGGTAMIGELGNTGGSKNGFILKTDSTSLIKWCKSVGFTIPASGTSNSNYESFIRLAETPDGGVVIGVINLKYPGSLFHPIIIKFDKDGNLVWSKEINPPTDSKGRFFSISTNENNEVFITGELQNTFDRMLFFIKLDEDGELIFGKKYLGENTLILPYSIDIEHPNLTTIWSVLIKFQPFRRHIGRIILDKDGNFVQMQTYTVNLSGFDGLEPAYVNPKKIEDNLYIGGYMNFDNLPETNRRATLLKIDSIGNVEFAKTYHDNSSNIIEGIEHIELRNNNLIVTFVDTYNVQTFPSPDPDESIVLAEITPSGDLLWNKVIDAGGREEYTRMELMDDQSLLLAAKSNSFATQTQGEWAIHQIKTTPELEFGDCTSTDSLEIIVEDLEIVQDTFFLESLPFESIQDVEIPVVDALVNVIMLCPQGNPNLTIKEIFRLNPCESDTLKIKARICNTGYAPLGAGVPVAFYDADPTNETATLLLSATLATDLPPTVCREVYFSLPMPSENTLFAAINDNGTEATPYDPASVFGNANFSDTDFFDNIRSFAINNYAAVFQQIDTSLCVGDTLLFGNVSIAPGQSDTLFLQTFAGCDSLVFIQTTEKLPAFATESIELCFGDSVLLFGNYVKETGIYEETFTAFSGCDSVHQVEIALLDELIPTIFIENEIGSNAMNGTVTIENVMGGNPPFSYLWNTGETTPIIENLTQGNYSVTITDNNNCTAIFMVEVDLEVATKQEAIDNFSIEIFPNPTLATDEITLLFQSKSNRTIDFEIVDVKGAVVLQKENIAVSVGETYLPIEFRFGAGIYFLKVLGLEKAIRLVVL